MRRRRRTHSWARPKLKTRKERRSILSEDRACSTPATSGATRRKVARVTPGDHARSRPSGQLATVDPKGACGRVFVSTDGANLPAHSDPAAHGSGCDRPHWSTVSNDPKRRNGGCRRLTSARPHGQWRRNSLTTRKSIRQPMRSLGPDVAIEPPRHFCALDIQKEMCQAPAGHNARPGKVFVSTPELGNGRPHRSAHRHDTLTTECRSVLPPAVSVSVRSLRLRHCSLAALSRPFGSSTSRRDRHWRRAKSDSSAERVDKSRGSAIPRR
jgi:hypothetical protein